MPDFIEIVAAAAVVVGHIFPVFAGFRGGKGVATLLGVGFGLIPIPALIALGIFTIVLLTFGYVSLARHSFDPLGPRRNLVYHLCSVFRFFIQSSPHTFYPIVRISHHWLALMRHRQFLVFLYYWQMKRQVSQTCLHSFTIIYLL